MTRRSVRTAALAALAPLPLLMASILVGSPAGAHEGDAIIEVDQVHPGATRTHYFVEVTWEDDGHPVVDGTVTATAVTPDGVEQTPVPLNPDPQFEGIYEGTVEMPEEGTWTVRFTSVDPTGSIEHTQEVAAAAPAEPETERSPEDEGAGAAGDDEAIPTDEAAPGEVAEIEATAVSDDGGPSILVLTLVFLVLAAAVAGIFWLVTRRSAALAAEGVDDGADDGAHDGVGAADIGDTEDAAVSVDGGGPAETETSAAETHPS